MQFQALQAGGQGLHVHHPEPQARLGGQGDVHQDLRQHPRAIGVFPIGQQLRLEAPLDRPLAILGAGELVQSGVDAIEMAVFLEQGDRRFRAHPLHSRDVV